MWWSAAPLQRPTSEQVAIHGKSWLVKYHLEEENALVFKSQFLLEPLVLLLEAVFRSLTCGLVEELLEVGKEGAEFLNNHEDVMS